ncbi:MAG TPA: glutathione S-transferase family protein [Solirubrobacteraceae bacterium]|jgi:glutathione S-transferase|nr:glutathione S-transferase family protein [Solirubrobacteraceae bacterium]
MSPVRLYFMPRTRSSRALWMLEEIGAPYELTEIAGAERRSAAHLERHPLGRVPALELDDGTVMFESAAICLQLADLHPDAGLTAPLGSSERALVYQWVLFAMTELEGPLFRWFGEIRDGITEPSAAQKRFGDGAAALQTALDGRDWVLGDRFTVADVMCASILSGAQSRGLLDPWPGLAAYVERSQARPAYGRAAAIDDRPRS